MSDIGGFISAPIKLAAIISNRRNATPNTKEVGKSTNGGLNCGQARSTNRKHEKKNCCQLSKRRTSSSCNDRLAPTAPTNNRQQPPSKFYLCSSKLAPSLLLILLIHLDGLCRLVEGDGGQLAWQRSRHNANDEAAKSHLLRHQTHYMNIVPSTHFQYNEGRQLASEQPGAQLASDDQPELQPHAENGGKISPSRNANSHIYKRSSALVSSAGGGGGSAHLYQPLVGSLHHQASQMNPMLRRRMMSEASSGSASQSRWLGPEQLAGEEQQLTEFLAAPTGSGGIDHPTGPLIEAPEARSQVSVMGSQLGQAAVTRRVASQSPKQRPSKPVARPEHEEAELLRQKQHIQYHDQWPSVAGKCHKRTLNFCASVLPFNTTTFPNIIGDTNRFEVKRSLPFFGFLAKSSCNKRLDELLCLLLEPPCGAQSGAAIPPCKKFCRLALEGCNEYIPATLAMSSVFDCRQYPDSNDPSVCINLAQGSKCAQDEFKCPDKTCIPRNWLCDGVRDCIFAADEANCTGIGLQTSVCSTEEFKCDGKCVPKAWRCDGERDCLDGTDEEACDQRPRCGPDRFRCADGNGCLPKRWVCDGKAECRDGSDEMNCEQRECSENDFKCNNGICIPKLWRCDQQFDCKDGSDERSCIYPQSTTSTTTTQPPTTIRLLEESNNFYLNTTYSVSGQSESQTQPSRQVNLESSDAEVPTAIVPTTLSGQQQQLAVDLNPMNYYSGEQQQSGITGSGTREQVESNVNDDVSRIIRQESSSSSPQPAEASSTLDSSQLVSSNSSSDAPISGQSQQSVGSITTESSASNSAKPTGNSKELNKFDYDIIQSSSSPASNLIQLTDLMLGEMANQKQLAKPQQQRQSMAQQQVLTQIDFEPQQQVPNNGRQVTPSSSGSQSLLAHQQQQQQQVIFNQRQLQQQVPGRSFGPQAKGTEQQPAAERMPIYRSLFKTLKHGQGRLAAASAANQQQRNLQAAGKGLRRRRDRTQNTPGNSAGQPISGGPTSAEDSLGSRFPHWSSPAPAGLAAESNQQPGGAGQAASAANTINHHNLHQQQLHSVGAANQTRSHGVASYLQLLNSRYNFRLPRVSPMPPTRAL